MSNVISGDISVVFYGGEVVGLGVYSDVPSLTEVHWDGVLREDVYHVVYEARSTVVVMSLGKYFYKSSFIALQPVGVCGSFVNLRGVLRSSHWHKVEHAEVPRIDFPEGEIFFPLVRVDCVKNSKLHRRIQHIVRVVESGVRVEGDGESPYYACVQDGLLGLCYNALSIL